MYMKNFQMPNRFAQPQNFPTKTLDFKKGPTVNQLLIETREKRTRGRRTQTRGQLNRGKACT